MVYLTLAIVIAVGVFLMWARIGKGWRERNTPAETRSKARYLVDGVGVVRRPSTSAGSRRTRSKTQR